MASHTRKIIVIGAAGVALAAAGILPAYVFAATESPTHLSTTHRRLKHLGTVSAIAGSSITLAAKNGTTYTVDAQNAKIMKAGTAVSLATVAVGDPIAVIGPTQGTTIDARVVFDKPTARLEHRGAHLGTVSAVAGSSITLAAKNGTTYTVDAQNAKIMKAGTAVSLATVAVGDPIAVIGPTQGTTIDARVVFDKPTARLEHRLEHRGAHHGAIIGGTIATMSSGEFTLVPKSHPGRPARPSILIDTNATTVVTRAGQPVPFSTLGVNSAVIVSGKREAKGATTLLASKIIIRNHQ